MKKEEKKLNWGGFSVFFLAISTSEDIINENFKYFKKPRKHRRKRSAYIIYIQGAGDSFPAFKQKMLSTELLIPVISVTVMK